MAEVICDSPQSSGFIVKLMPERNQHLLSAVSERYDLAASIYIYIYIAPKIKAALVRCQVTAQHLEVVTIS